MSQGRIFRTQLWNYFSNYFSNFIQIRSKRLKDEKLRPLILAPAKRHFAILIQQRKSKTKKMDRPGVTFRTPQVPKVRRSKSNENSKRKSFDSTMVRLFFDKRRVRRF